MESSVVLGQSATATATTIRALEESIAYRAKFLTEYQNQSYARNLGGKFEGDVRLQIPSCHAATGAPRQGDGPFAKERIWRLDDPARIEEELEANRFAVAAE